MEQSSTEKLVSMVRLLDGPSVKAEEIEWAVDLEAGKTLIDWLAAQTPLHLDVEESSLELAQKIVLTGIALEREEVEALANVKTNPGSDGNAICMPKNYSIPSEAREHAKLMDLESTYIEDATELLRARLKQTKIANRKMTQTIKDLKHEIGRTSDGISASQERLAEMSIKAPRQADSTFSASIRCASEVLDVLESKGAGNVPTNTELNAYANYRSAVLTRTQQQVQDVVTAAAGLPSEAELEQVANRAAKKLYDRDIIKAAEEVFFCQQMEEVCRELEQTDRRAGVANLLLRVKSAQERQVDEDTAAMNISEELEIAWRLDQMSLLNEKSQVLQNAVKDFEDNIIPSLQSLYDSVKTSVSYMAEAEGLIAALGEEVEEIVESSRLAKDSRNNFGLSEETKTEAQTLQAGLVDLLKKLQDLRPASSEPLVLLDHEDVLRELKAVKEQERSLESEEELGAAALIQGLEYLRGSLGLLLSDTYLHAPLNTSPPYALPLELRNLERETQKKSEELRQSVAILQKNVGSLDSERSKKKLRSLAHRVLKS
ncbi:uncharacterized protein BT62DRAFT_1073366 [Guyanagaster necrorhizus]|uniref:Uncharacterized protein n=1 Tax=Guyanagaster necrorhizus TaxID=856835 RepID=A0A9P7W0J8_9AGAR|nr:uncharacterized protein BT62DRAFT_1073366 [Guyanagaster necrorhizus MCA 3950]KAG7449967.1 hypothetical protein BT62DRAFT_1073366 [Guyanagaster necrorhizus MCA 3950]